MVIKKMFDFPFSKGPTSALASSYLSALALLIAHKLCSLSKPRQRNLRRSYISPHSIFTPQTTALESSTAQDTRPAKMDAGKIPVKLVKVTRVLGRTGTPLLPRQILRLRLCIGSLESWGQE